MSTLSRCWVGLCALSLFVLFGATPLPLNAEEPQDPIAELQRRLDQLERDNQELRDLFRDQVDSNQFLAPQELSGRALIDGTAGNDAVPPSTQDAEYISGIVGSSVKEQTLGQNKTIAEQAAKITSLESSIADIKKAASAKTYPTAKLTGFFQADSVWVSQDSQNQFAIVNGAPLGDIQNGADFRRARLAATGDAYKNVGYMLEMDFAFPGRPTFMDVWLEVREVPGMGSVRVGQFRQPFGMDALTGVKELIFLERGITQAFVPFRQIGASYAGNDEAYGVTWSGAVFRYPADNFGGNVGDDGGYGLSGRFTSLFIEGPDNETVHFGGNYCFADPSNNVLQFRNQPELFDTQVPGSPFPVAPAGTLPFFVDTGLIPTQNFSLYGLEFAAARGSWLTQSEFMITNVDQIGPGANLTFWGAYSQVAYVLTGEHHEYNKKSGVYGRVKPTNPLDFGDDAGLGAWEIAARWSILDLTDKNIHGNQVQDYTLGLNWYLNNNTKFQFNYIHSILDSPGQISEADLFALRAQVDF